MQAKNIKPKKKSHGSGKIVENPCKECHKNGYVRKKVKISVNIPAGVDNDSVIPLKGQRDVAQ